jgi:hypothetical protein
MKKPYYELEMYAWRKYVYYKYENKKKIKASYWFWKYKYFNKQAFSLF